MGFALRGLRAVALLVGFYVMLLLFVVIMVAVDVASVVDAVNGTQPVGDTLRSIPIFLLVTGLVGLAAYRAVTVSTKSRVAEYGVRVDAAREPRLTARVAELARVVGTRAPDEIWIINEVNAAVSEDARMLGLLSGRRRMLIGAPLLLTLTPAQLDAVLAHELGHYSNRDTRFTPIIGRGRLALQAALGTTGKGRRRTRTRGGRVKTVSTIPGQSTLHRILGGYAKLFYLITQADARRAEYAADRYSAVAAGREAAASALGELGAVHAVFQFFLGRYASSGVDLGLVPSPEVLYPGFAELLEQPERQQEMAEIRKRTPAQEQGKYDSHPPIPERIAAIMALSAAETGAGASAARMQGADGGVREEAGFGARTGSGPGDGVDKSVSILDERDTLLSDAAARLLAKQTGKRQVAWPELVGTAAHAQDVKLGEGLGKAVTAVAGRLGTLEVLLDLVDAGQSGAVYGQLVQQGAGPAQRERVFRMRVWAWIVLKLEEQGRATRRLSWTEFEAVDIEPELRARLEAGLDAVVRASKGEAAADPAADAAALAELREQLKLG